MRRKTKAGFATGHGAWGVCEKEDNDFLDHKSYSMHFPAICKLPPTSRQLLAASCKKRAARSKLPALKHLNITYYLKI
jgi:hypothetical protein